ncbi:MAG: ArsR family transcriptional regulator [Deltaproteobacteria bacterium]|nr:ArsR family transcriptional regulator [Deltaproteobacteria bacterium]
MKKKSIKCGIISRKEFMEMTIAIAKGEYKPKRGMPKVWFESLQTMAQVLSNENQKLLDTIIKQKPESIKDLADLTGREKSNVSRTLKKMRQYGIVGFKVSNGAKKPIVNYTDFKLEFGLNTYPAFLLDDQ